MDQDNQNHELVFSLNKAKELAAEARRVVAAECSFFLSGETATTVGQKEDWIPFRHWASTLGVNDTIVTFNYDRVVELACPKAHVITNNDLVDEAHHAGLPILLKLHGSVDWRHNRAQRTGSGTRSTRDDSFEQVTDNPTFALTCDADELLIATPGPSKMEISRKILKPLWDRAQTKLREADEVTLIGYRFPESDSYPLQTLLRALNSDCEFRIVLGQGKNEDCARIRTLIQTTLQQAVSVLDMNQLSQDFLVCSSEPQRDS